MEIVFRLSSENRSYNLLDPHLAGKNIDRHILLKELFEHPHAEP